MFTPELASLDFQECADLPAGTIVAPMNVLREIRCAIGPTRLNLIVGVDTAVHVSSDLFSAYHAWEQEQSSGSREDENQAWLN